jgi:Flp pilus assembly protein TadD
MKSRSVSDADPLLLKPPQAMQKAAALYSTGDWVKAEKLCKIVVRAQPDHIGALNLLAIIAARTGRSPEAAELLHRAVAAHPDDAALCNNYGNVLKGLGRFNEALEKYERALELRPDYTEAYNNRGTALRQLGRFDEALDSHERALRLRPGSAQAYNNRGLVLTELGRLEEALVSYEHALALDPLCAEACNSRGVLFCLRNELARAAVDYDSAIALKPDFPEAYQNRAHVSLLTGDFEKGWVDYEWRWRHGAQLRNRARFAQPPWLGTAALAGKTIALYGEQGLGDTLQFCRYVRLVAQLGAKVILEVPAALANLLTSLDGVATLVTHGEPLPAVDYHCPLMSLPLAFGTTVSTIPAKVPYLKSDGNKVSAWRERLGEKRKLRVGLVWSGGFRSQQPEHWGVNSRRNIPLAQLAPLQHPAVEFLSLQKGQPAESELAQLLSRHWNGPPLIDFTEQLHDFSDTAALIENLDLVISVDTSTAHLAGALGKPVWIMNRFDSCWRWLLDRTDSPWYPTARLYRQQRAGDWDGVVQCIRADLLRVAGVQ